MNQNQHRRVLSRMLDENEFLSPMAPDPCLGAISTIPMSFPSAVKNSMSITPQRSRTRLRSEGNRIGADRSGWTGIVARLIQMFAVTTSGDILVNDFTKLAYSRDLDLVK